MGNANSYRGQFHVLEGTLSGSQGNLTFDILNNDTVEFFDPAGNNGTYGSTMTGTGVLNKEGGGIVSISGTSNTYSGDTNINGGGLNVTGSAANSVFIVNNSAEVSGDGTIGGLIVNSGGIAAPGDSSIDQLNINGNITFESGSVYQVETNIAGDSDKLVATGGANINGGKVSVLAGAGNYNASTRYTIITANNGVTDKFDNLETDLAFLTPTLDYDANNVYLILKRNDISFADPSGTFNQRQAATGVDSLTTGNAVYDAIVQLSAGQAPQALDNLSGEIYASVHSAMIQNSQALHHTLSSNAFADKLKPVHSNHLWGILMGQSGDWNGDGNAHELSRNSYGALFGYDTLVNDWTVGVAAGFRRSNYNVDAVNSSADANNFTLGTYANHSWPRENGSLNLSIDTAYTFSDVSATRNVIIGNTLNETLNADYKTKTWQINSDIGYAIPIQNLILEPYTGLGFVNSNRDGFTENGGASALRVNSKNANNIFATIGARIEKPLNTESPGSRLFADIAYQHAFKKMRIENTSSFATGSNNFNTRGISAGQNIGLINVGVDYKINPQSSVKFDINGGFGSGISSYGAAVNVKWKF